MRKPILAGNWKMNKTRDQAIHFFLEVDHKLPKEDVECVVCAPSVLLRTLSKRADTLKIGAQNMNEHDSGAYTGEISALMVKDAGAQYVILGHSERRAYYGETDEIVSAKIKKALEFELKPIVCVGETLQERESDKTSAVIETQITKGFAGVTFANPDDVIIAYEPVWAIGTGKSATSAQAQEVCKLIRDLLAKIYSKEVADKIRILYGGSVNTKNVDEIMAQPDIDGGLVGGASLKEDDFLTLCKACVK